MSGIWDVIFESKKYMNEKFPTKMKCKTEASEVSMKNYWYTIESNN